MIANGTLLGVAPIRTSLLVVSLTLTLLFTLVEPAVSNGLGVIARFLFWVLHIGLGMLGILLASVLMRGWTSGQTLPVWWVLTLTGFAGAVMIVPVYYWIEGWYPNLANDPDSPFDLWGQTGVVPGMLVELSEVAPILMLCWYSVNLPLLFNRPQLHLPPPPDEPPEPEHREIEDADALAKRQLLERLYQELPQVLGQEIVAISSDLHYLNVHTSLGKTLILGSLKHYADAFGDQGTLVHRSHWVANAHVRQVQIRTDKAFCLMSTGLMVPVSRSRRKAVKETFGTGAVNLEAQPPKLRRVK